MLKEILQTQIQVPTHAEPPVLVPKVENIEVKTEHFPKLEALSPPPEQVNVNNITTRKRYTENFALQKRRLIFSVHNHIPLMSL